MTFSTGLSGQGRTQESSAKLELVDFEAALNSEFQMETSSDVNSADVASGYDQNGEVHADVSPGSLTLVLTQCKVRLSNSMQECFSLVFQAPPEAPPVQGSYLLHHPVIGSSSIFLVPFKKTEAGLFYEAIFNRLLA